MEKIRLPRQWGKEKEEGRVDVEVSIYIFRDFKKREEYEMISGIRSVPRS